MRSRSALMVIPILLFARSAVFAQGPPRIPNATPEQMAALARMNSELTPQVQRLADVRSGLVAVSLSIPRNAAAIRAKAADVRAAELELANARADAFAKLQASANRFASNQIPALAAATGAPPRGGGGRGAARTSMPHVAKLQAIALTEISSNLAPQSQSLEMARREVTTASLAVPKNADTIRAAVDAVASAELALANARASALAAMQATADKLDTEQLAWLVAAGGVYPGAGFTEPERMDFNDRRGYVSLFDGVSLKGWDGNPKFWRVEGGAIVGESTADNPSGNTYIAYRGVEAKDFTLKFEIKIEGDGGSGVQYRSQTGIPWTRPIPANVTANVGPVNLNWMMTGPQADFWPSRIYTGQFYSENTPMGIMAWRGQVVEGAGLAARRLMGTIGDRAALGNLVKTNDWNEYTVIARGGTFIHIVNGQLMAVMVDDDPESSNNQPGIFGIEIEATTKVSVRNIWLKKLN